MAGERFVSIDEIESVIRQLRDVLSARVVADQRGAIQEIHVLISGSRNPKQTVRDIESAVMARLGVSVDHRKVSVAQISEERLTDFPPRDTPALIAPEPPSPAAPEPPAPVPSPPAAASRQETPVLDPPLPAAVPSNGQSGKQYVSGRLRVHDVAVAVNGAVARATVRLTDGSEDIYIGTAEGPNTSHNQLRLVATATLAAVQQARGAWGTYVIEDVSASVQMAGRRVVVALINVLTDRGEETFSGSAIVKQDLWKATVNASLDAINRQSGLHTN